MSALTKIESDRLDELEAIIEHSAGEARTALREIRDSRLYRKTHETFEDYCQERWGITRRAANFQIGADEARELVTRENPGLGSMLPKLSDRAVTELAKAPAEKRVEITKEAQSSGGKVTGKTVKETMGRVSYGKPFGELKGGKDEAPEPKPRKKKNGAERVPAKLRLGAEAAFGKLMAVLSKMGLADELGDELETIIKAIKGA